MTEAPARAPVRWTDRVARPGGARPRRFGRAAIAVFAVLAAAAVLLAATAWQLTAERTAEPMLAHVAQPLFEIDRTVEAALPALADAGGAASLPGYPFDVPVPAPIRNAGAAATSEYVLEQTADQLYRLGFEAISQRAGDDPALLSDGAAFSISIGRLTAGGHEVALAALAVTAAIWLFLSLAVLGSQGVFAGIDAVIASCGGGGGAVLIAAVALRSVAEDRAAGALDPFTRAVWEVAVQAGDLLAWNAGAVAVAAVPILAARIAGAWFLRRTEAALAA